MSTPEPFRSMSLLLAAVLAAQTAAAPARFETQQIDDKVEIGYGLAIGDVDGDGKPDILLADKRQIVWYRNGDWRRFVMAEDLTPRDNVCIAARDIDGDGKVEVAVGGNWNPGETTDLDASGSVHYLVRPSDPARMRWTAVRLPHEPTVHRMRWLRGPEGGYSLVVLPLHGRGNRGGEGEPVRVLAYHPPPDPTDAGGWKLELLDASMHMTHNLDVVRWDEEEVEDLLIAGREGVALLRHEDGAWSRTMLCDGAHGGAGEVRGERGVIATIEPMHGHELVVYHPPGEGGDDLWRRTALTDELKQGHALACADFLGLGRDQMAVGWREANQAGRVGVKLFIPPVEGDGAWSSMLIDDNEMACEDLAAADLDGDGRLDLIAAGRATRNLRIYWNRAAGE